MAEGDPAMVISTAAMGGRAGESQMRFHTEVALSDQTGCFIVSSDLTDSTEGDLVTDPIIVRQGKTEVELFIFMQ